MPGHTRRRAVFVGRGLAALAITLAAAGAAFATGLEQEARELEAMLIAPCCFSQQVSVHQSPAAAEVRQDIRRRLAAGETREQILDAYVAQYGRHVLVQPRAEGFGRTLYLLPPVVLGLTAALLVVAVRRFTTHRTSPARVAYPATVPADERYRAALDEELRELD